MSERGVVTSCLAGRLADRSDTPELGRLLCDASRRFADRIACTGPGLTLSYAELHLTAARLAGRLAPFAGRAGAHLALFLDRGPLAAAAIVGCLTARVPFVPIGKDDAAGRMAKIAGAAEPVAVITDTAEVPPPLASCEVIRLDQAMPGELPPDPPIAPTAADFPAYTMFTSGSTGAPKGVTVGHHALRNRLLWAIDDLDLGEADVVMQKTPYTFDVALWEILAPLLAGARTAYLGPGLHRDPLTIIHAVCAEKVTVCHFVPSMLDEFLRWPAVAECQSLRHVVCSGEALRPASVRAFGAALPGVVLSNLYGPTEAAIDVTRWRAPSTTDCDEVLIGEPIDNTTLLVVDGDLRPVPTGAVGELLITGTPLARGYLGQPDLTARAFVTLPDGSRAYRTGDRVRVIGKNLEFLGRIDDQIKMRGVRVEPREIELALSSLAGVRDVAVVAIGRRDRAKLAAFVASSGEPRPGAAWAAADLSKAVRDHVAMAVGREYAPDAVFTIGEIPATSSGKRDRARLGEIACELLEAGSSAVTEETDPLTRAWAAEVGDATHIGFLDAGGHSLGAMRLAFASHAAYGARIPLSWLLTENLTLVDLRTRLAAVSASHGPPLTAASRHRLSPAQFRLWTAGQLHGSLAAYNVVHAMVVRPAPSPQHIGRRLAGAVVRHEALRARVAVDATGLPYQFVSDERIVPYSAEQAIGDRDYYDRLARVEATLPRIEFSLNNGPPFEVVAVGTADGAEMTVFLAASHLFFDQQSVNILWEELFGASLPGGSTLPVPEEPDADRIVADTGYWSQSLRGLPARLPLPATHRRDGLPAHAGRTATRTLSPDDLTRLAAVAADGGVEMNHLLLAAYARSLGERSHVNDLVVGVPADRRASLAEANAIGFFVESVPVRAGNVRQRHLIDLAQHIRDSLREAAAHDAGGFDTVVRAAGHTPALTHNPIFQAWFNDLSSVELLPVTTGRTFSARRLPSPPALFDVNLYLYRASDGGVEIAVTVAADLLPLTFAHAIADDVARCARGQKGDRPGSSPGPLSGLLTAALADHGDPGAIAIRAHDGDLSRAELALAADRISAFLRHHVGTGTSVAVLAERSGRLPAVLLGGWRAGTPLVIVDARLPRNYLRPALEAARVDTVVSLGAAGPADLCRRRLAYADMVTSEASAAPPHGADPAIHYLLTSGSTGRPKLVGVNGPAFAAALEDVRSGFGLTAADRFCFMAGAGHDPMFREVIAPLTVGASVSVPAPDMVSDPRALLGYLAREQVTVLFLTPARGHLLLNAAAVHASTLGSVRLVVFAGAPLPMSVARAFGRLCPSARILNGYGTTEIPQLSSVWEMCGPDPARPDPAMAPIGTGFGHRRLVLADSAGPAGPAGPGTIAAIGVLERDEDVMLTGDQGWTEPDGTLHWSGRADRHLSVNGYLLDPSEVEAACRRLPGVADALLTAEAEPAGFLTAFVAGQPGIRLTDADMGLMLASLAAVLPPWACPDRLVLVTELGIDHNGKVCRPPEELWQAAAGGYRTGAAAVAPDLGLVFGDRALLSFPAGVRERPDANFFEAGLDSFGVLRLLAALRTAGTDDVELVDIFRWPTLAGLSDALRQRRSAKPRSRGAAS